MTKVFALLSLATVFAFASCGDKKPEDTAVDTAAVVVPVADTTTAVADTAAAKVDTAAAAPAAH